MAVMLDLSDHESKTTMMNRLRALMEKIDNMQEQMGNVRREMANLKRVKKKCSANGFIGLMGSLDMSIKSFRTESKEKRLKTWNKISKNYGISTKYVTDIYRRKSEKDRRNI